MTAKKEIIQKRIEKGDKRSYNEIAADLELDIWKERSAPMIMNRNFSAKKNRARTNGRKIQSVDGKQIKHL